MSSKLKDIVKEMKAQLDVLSEKSLDVSNLKTEYTKFVELNNENIIKLQKSIEQQKNKSDLLISSNASMEKAINEIKEDIKY